MTAVMGPAALKEEKFAPIAHLANSSRPDLRHRRSHRGHATSKDNNGPAPRR
ncbi:hypothetical protein PF003_g15844 [Phytophthora fragariae]|nr:hypothetical protein PF003_g15844 [Phytophthora fragariae]